MIVLQGLKGKSVTEICNEHQIGQAQYYQWRDQFLANAPKAFDTTQTTQKELRQQNEINRLRAMVGELTLELKKATRRGYEASVSCKRCRR